MTKVIAIMGRPNVGKSTLFNRLTRTRDALVTDRPGVTRDRKIGTIVLAGGRYRLVDTGGLGDEEEELSVLVRRQAMQAAEEADAVFFVVDGQDGLTAGDQDVAEELRRRGQGKPIFLLVNKVEGQSSDMAGVEFHALGLGTPHAISAKSGRGLAQLAAVVAEGLPPEPDEVWGAEDPGIRMAILGRPNVGKSTLLNRMLGEERMVTSDIPGTTRDSIAVPFERDGQRFTLVDTAGVRRRSRIADPLEKFSVLKTLEAIDAAEVVVIVLDARAGIVDQDLTLLGMALESGRSLLLAVNKWDNLPISQRRLVEEDIARRFRYLDYAEVHYISALHGSGVGGLFAAIAAAWRSAYTRLPTHEITEILNTAVGAYPPPMVRGRRPKMRYAHLGGQNPPRIIIHGNLTESLPDSYRRYLEGYFRKALRLVGTPVKVEFRQGENPYAEEKNTLSPRQQGKRQRLLRHKRGR